MTSTASTLQRPESLDQRAFAKGQQLGREFKAFLEAEFQRSFEVGDGIAKKGNPSAPPHHFLHHGRRREEAADDPAETQTGRQQQRDREDEENESLEAE